MFTNASPGQSYSHAYPSCMSPDRWMTEADLEVCPDCQRPLTDPDTFVREPGRPALGCPEHGTPVGAAAHVHVRLGPVADAPDLAEETPATPGAILSVFCCDVCGSPQGTAQGPFGQPYPGCPRYTKHAADDPQYELIPRAATVLDDA